MKKRDGEWSLDGKDIIRGRIEWTDEFSDTNYETIFIIDGKKITMKEFGHILRQWEGWHFKLKILDPCDKDT